MVCVFFLLPFFGFCAASLFGRFLGARGAALITSSCVGASFLLACTLFVQVGLGGQPCVVYIYPWVTVGLFDASWSFCIDSLTAVMGVIVTSVSTIVHVYSISYMSHDPHLPRFMSYLSLFTFFMLMLITGDNFFILFLGWEGVGLASYLLINFWFTRLQANKSAIKAMLMNRVGDFGLALGIFTAATLTGTTNFAALFACAPAFQDSTFVLCGIEFHALTCVCLFLFLAAVGKSAQLGLHTWLPDAMEGPTPVSALIHAATMVTAGVYLLARCSPLFEYSPFALNVVALVGALTAFFAATVGVVQNDVKRVIAYSTCSQLGYMVAACGLSFYSIAIFHLATHAFFKALLFLSAGSIIHGFADEQDMRGFGKTVRLLPLTYAFFVLGSLALVGFPWLSGFYSKDAILESAFGHGTPQGYYIFWLGCAAALCTAYYSTRVLYLCFFGNQPRGPATSYSHAHEAPVLMVAPLIPLVLGSIFLGFCGRDLFFGPGTDFWGNAIFVLPHHTTPLDAEFCLETDFFYWKFLPLGVTFLGAFLAVIFHGPLLEQCIASAHSVIGRAFYIFANRRWLVDVVYNEWIGRPLLTFGYHFSFKTLDKGVFEHIGPTGIMTQTQILLPFLRRIQSGKLYHYAFAFVVAATFFLACVLAGPQGLFTHLFTAYDPRWIILFMVCSVRSV